MALLLRLDREFWKIMFLPTMLRLSVGLSRQVLNFWEKQIWTNLPWVLLLRIPLLALQEILVTQKEFRADLREVRQRRWPLIWLCSRSVLILVARFVSRPVFVAWSALSPLMVGFL